MTFELRMRDNYKNGRAEGLAEGKAEGLAQGKAQAEAKTVKAMYTDHVPVNKIAKYVSLTEAEVQNILSAK